MKRIYWLASYPKSGNTWVRAFLSAYHNDGAVDINRLTHTCGDLQTYWYQMCTGKPIKDLQVADYLMLRCAAMFNLSESLMGDPLVVKTHNVDAMIDRCILQPSHVTAGALYIVRDPRDLVISWAAHLGFTIDETIAKLNDERFVIHNQEIPHILSTWTHHTRSWWDEDKFPVLAIRYEDMLDEPEKNFRAILEFQNIDVDEPRMVRAIEAAGFNRLRKQEQENGFTERRNQDQFFARGTHGHWRKVLTDAQAERIERDHGEMMTRIGYELAYAKDKAA